MSKRLTKSSSNQVLTGTLAGIAEYLNIDPTIVRVIYMVVFFLGWGSPVLLYIVLAILMPKAPNNRPRYYYQQNQPKHEEGHPYFTGNDEPKRPEAKKVQDDDDDENWSDF